MDWQRDDIRQVPDPNRINKQQIPQWQEVPSPQEIPGKEAFLERPDVPAKPPMPAMQPYSSEWIHTRQGFIKPRKNVFQRILSRFSAQHSRVPGITLSSSTRSSHPS